MPQLKAARAQCDVRGIFTNTTSALNNLQKCRKWEKSIKMLFSRGYASPEIRTLDLDITGVTFHPWRYGSLGCQIEKFSCLSILA